MGVSVAASEAVGDGSGLGVSAGVIVGVRGITKLNPPQAIRVSIERQTKRVLLITSWQRFVQRGQTYNGWFKSHRMRRPSSVSQGAMIWITSVSCAMIAESPPVAITFISFPSSLRNRSTMPSTMLT